MLITHAHIIIAYIRIWMKWHRIIYRSEIQGKADEAYTISDASRTPRKSIWEFKKSFEYAAQKKANKSYHLLGYLFGSVNDDGNKRKEV